ncbi:hypothetical protein AB0I68_38495 [Streptomyces sp. NPDC050448]|uniref:hypothetical protein n=1 Tax=Streptomyces sp. NPDC050448 TaxID=3155404 RepID=UPI0034159D60
MNRHPAPQEPAHQGDTAPRYGTKHLSPLPRPMSGPLPRARRATARHRKSSSRWLVAGLTLASVLTATVLTVAVDPAAPPPSGKASSQFAR